MDIKALAGDSQNTDIKVKGHLNTWPAATQPHEHNVVSIIIQ